ncbi:kinesin-like protein KIF20A isoform X2 [Petromyzon marinus]|uniref:kinesin-like protein KIF20A isoform X2 n=1 Tax=Petromyzon marinus TaxID=7757 RepID=UPI003F70F492
MEAEGSRREEVREQSRTLQGFLRVRPFSREELQRGEDQGCLELAGPSVLLSLPKAGVTSLQKFTFTQVLGPACSQLDAFEATVRAPVCACVRGDSALVFTYGVTSSGKTHTLMGSTREPGLLPRALGLLFGLLGDRQYRRWDLRPLRHGEVQRLEPDEVEAERRIRAQLLATEEDGAPVRGVRRSRSAPCLALLHDGDFTASPILPILESTSLSQHLGEEMGRQPDREMGPQPDREMDGQPDREMGPQPAREMGPQPAREMDGQPEGNQLFSVWVSFVEIYNESMRDLLVQEDAGTASQPNRATTLRLGEDSNGHPYLKDVRWVGVSTAGQALCLLARGRRQQSVAQTRLNQTSSRSHSIFTVRLLRVQDEGGSSLVSSSELTLCDLAGSERSNKTQATGQRLKEANNINGSLLTLGRCLQALRANQEARAGDGGGGGGGPRAPVPFRESRLTRLFQAALLGGARVLMVACANPCASTLHETAHTLAFAALAQQVVSVASQEPISMRVRGSVRGGSAGGGGGAAERGGLPSNSGDDNEEEDEEVDLSSDDEIDVEALVGLVSRLRGRVVAERAARDRAERQAREEVARDAMTHLRQVEALWSQRLEAERQASEERWEERLRLYTDAMRRFACRSAATALALPDPGYCDGREEQYSGVEPESLEEARKVIGQLRRENARLAGLLQGGTGHPLGPVAVPPSSSLPPPRWAGGGAAPLLGPLLGPIHELLCPSQEGEERQEGGPRTAESGGPPWAVAHGGPGGGDAPPEAVASQTSEPDSC